MVVLRGKSQRDLPLYERLSYIKELKAALTPFPLAPATLRERIEILLRNQELQYALSRLSWLRTQIPLLNLEERHALMAFLAIGEGLPCLTLTNETREPLYAFRRLLERLVQLEALYKTRDGLIGYQLLFLEKLLEEEQGPGKAHPEITYTVPPAIDIRKKTPLVEEAVQTALLQMQTVAECYVVGGAAERLKFCDPQTQRPLPAALFAFGGLSSLLAWLVRDLEAREALAIEVSGKEFVTPVILMTSVENHDMIVQFCRESHWFGRPAESFFFVQQPLVPVLTERGNWVMEGPMQVSFKASGHGTLWIQLEEAGLLKSLQLLGIRKLLVRQINNPFCGLDDGILAFAGFGLMRDKKFGFASCERKVGAPEGMDVLRVQPEEDKLRYCLTNIEYTTIQARGIQETSMGQDSEYSLFPANTNILFADLAEIEKALKVNPLPGLLLNMKTHIEEKNAEGKPVDVRAGRLESTMQNIADSITDLVPKEHFPLQWDSLSTYLTCNTRLMTLSVVKNAFCEGKDLFGTPPACFYDLQCNLRALLVDVCHMQLPLLPSLEEYVESEPAFWLQISPRLGPLYSLIAKKILGGHLNKGAHLVLELSKLLLRNLQLEGSLQIYAAKTGICHLDNVRIRNCGVHYMAGKYCWRGDLALEETCLIQIEADGAFYAKDVILEGNMSVYVKSGTVITAYCDEKGQVQFREGAATHG